MRMNTSLLTGALCLAVATPAYACNFYFASTFMKVPAKPSFGVGVNGELGDATIWGISGDVAMRLGDQAVVQPAIGICTGDGETQPFFGAGAAYRLLNDANMALNLQSGISYLSADGGNEMTIPIGAALSFKRSETMSLYAGGSLWWKQSDPDVGESHSDTDPVFFGGLQVSSGPMAWTFGAQLRVGDNDTEFGIVVGANMNQGVNAIRSFLRGDRRQHAVIGWPREVRFFAWPVSFLPQSSTSATARRTSGSSALGTAGCW
jgi:hypothetical protein